MTREQFTGLFLGYIIRKAPTWLAEEDTDAGHLDNMQHRLGEHNSEIQNILFKYSNGNTEEKRRCDDA